MNKIRPLSKRDLNNFLPFTKINKVNNSRRSNMSSFARRTSYNNPKLYRTLSLISRNKFKEKQKLFSLLDINDKITNSKGPSLPEQFRRLTDDENKKLFGFSYRINKQSNVKDNQMKIINKSEENIILNENEKNNKNNKKINRCLSDLGERLKVKKNNFFNRNIKINKNHRNENFKNSEIQIDDSNKEHEIFNFKKNPIKLINNFSVKTPVEMLKLDNKLENEKNKDNNEIFSSLKKDRWLPKGYSSYELLVKHPQLFRKKIKIEYSMKKTSSAKLLKENAYKSDIFFFKPPSNKEVTYKNKYRYRNYQNSDIFNLKNDSQNLSKSGETYLFRKTEPIRYNISRESNSQWKLSENNMPTFTNSSSKNYNIINPNSKSISLGKDKIVIECQKMKDKNSKMINNINYMNPTYRQKGLTEFIDITRNGASNIGRDYIKAYNDNPKIFYKNNNICTTYHDIHFQYKNLCKQPFVKNFFD